MSKRSRRHFPLLTPIILGLLFVFITGIFIFLGSITAPVSQHALTPVEFTITYGDSPTKIARALYEAGLIRSPLGFRYVLRRENLGNQLQAGIYSLSPSMTASEIAHALTRGIADLKLVIPEGYRREEIADTAASLLGIPPSEFLALTKNLEGYLFPDTYFVAPNTSAQELVKLLQDNFTTKVGPIDQTTLILASLIERETKGDAEKSVVAGILQKRLTAGWPLELDATVQYALGKPGAWWPNTTLADRKTNSLYNTYLNPGLPPGPIANPGLASINAAKTPQDSPYWFYLHTPDGQIYYAETLEGHNSNIERYLR